MLLRGRIKEDFIIDDASYLKDLVINYEKVLVAGKQVGQTKFYYNWLGEQLRNLGKSPSTRVFTSEETNLLLFGTTVNPLENLQERMPSNGCYKPRNRHERRAAKHN